MTSKGVQSSQAAGASTPLETPALVHEIKPLIPEGTAGDTAWEREQASTAHEESDRDRMIDQIGDMTEGKINEEETNLDDISPEEKQRQEEIPRNPKKRMYEAEVEEPRKDEL